ncbi:hypothetical protein [Halalkalibacterium halodurans]|uniref:hypothetical protein n=1 Tax=Halalkalibacterium halodurans TaxID=86665 RepID=UPI002E1BF929|nr:hypothetical protein [Halalkalibacterium halodurans]
MRYFSTDSPEVKTIVAQDSRLFQFIEIAGEVQLPTSQILFNRLYLQLWSSNCQSKQRRRYTVG